MNLNLLENVINNINLDWTISLSDIISAFISVLSVIVTIVIAFKTINKNNKNVNKQLTQQQQNFQQQLDESRKNHAENKNIELRKNQIEYLPIIDIQELTYIGDGRKATFHFTLKNIGNGTALNCFLNTDDNLVVYNDSIDSGLQYIQSSPGKFMLNVNDSSKTSLSTNRLPNKSAHNVCFSITYNDLMGRIYKQPFEFFYDGVKIVPKIANKYEWECIKDIEFKS